MTEGWAAIPNWLVRDGNVTAYAKLLYTVIQSHAGSTGSTRLLNSTIAKEANVSPKTVERYLNELVALGVLYWVAQGDATRRSASIFHPLAEPDKALVKARHRPARARKKAETASPASTVPETVLTQVNPQDSAAPADSVPSVSPVGTVPESTAIPSEGRYVPSEGRREEEPSKKNPLPSSYSSPPPPGMAIATGAWRPRWDPSPESVAKMRALHGHVLNDLSLMRIADDLFAWTQKEKKPGLLEDRMFERFVGNEVERLAKIERDEERASREERKPKNPMFE